MERKKSGVGKIYIFLMIAAGMYGINKCLASFGIYPLTFLTEYAVGPGGMIFSVLLFLGLLIALVWGVLLFNRLAQTKNNVQKALKNVDVLLSLRYSEITKLEEIYRSYKDHESSLLACIGELRARCSGSLIGQGGSENEKAIRGQIKTLIGAMEGYPTLKAGESYQIITKAVSRIEKDLAERRAFYNEAAKIHNALIETIPYCLLARAIGYDEFPYFES